MAARNTRHILLVDSDESMLDVLKIALKGCGYRLQVARDGQEAVQSILEQAPDLIIMELMLPVLDGLRLLRWLRSEQGPELPVLVLTALDRPGIHDTVTGLDVAALVYKPIGRSELLRQVRKLLPAAPAARSAASA